MHYGQPRELVVRIVASNRREKQQLDSNLTRTAQFSRIQRLLKPFFNHLFTKFAEFVHASPRRRRISTFVCWTNRVRGKEETEWCRNENMQVSKPPTIRMQLLRPGCSSNSEAMRDGGGGDGGTCHKPQIVFGSAISRGGCPQLEL